MCDSRINLNYYVDMTQMQSSSLGHSTKLVSHLVTFGLGVVLVASFHLLLLSRLFTQQLQLYHPVNGESFRNRIKLVLAIWSLNCLFILRLVWVRLCCTEYYTFLMKHPESSRPTL